jgi:hypothetical protein
VSSRPTLTGSLAPSASARPSAAPSALGSLGPGVAFDDRDGDGVLDPGEDVLAGVAVDLYCEVAPGQFARTATVQTDAAGAYLFAQVRPARCYVSVAPVVDGNDNYVFGPVVDGGNQIFPNGTSPSTDIGYNENADGWDVGYVWFYAIMDGLVERVGSN